LEICIYIRRIYIRHSWQVQVYIFVEPRRDQFPT
jgi:hypothetical protein